MKLGLVLEGGAHRTYFSAGIMDFLLEKGIKADYVIGASAGIANGTSYVSGQIGRNLEIATKFVPDKHYMGFHHLLRPSNRSYYNVKFVFNEIPNKYLPFDYAAFDNAPCDAIAVVTNIKTGEPEYLKVTSEDKEWKTVIASCSLPFMFQPIDIGDNTYMDGGITDPIPFKKAIQDGCDKSIVILTRERDYVKTKETGAKLAARSFKKYPKFKEALLNRTDIYNKDHQELLKLEKEGKIFLFAPENTKGWSRTDSDPEKLQMIYETGYNIAKDRFEDLKKYLSS